MSSFDSNLSDILGTAEYIPTSSEEKNPITIHQPQTQEKSAHKIDAEFSRSNYYNLIEKGNEAIDGILNVARDSQHPRAYEVAATLIKNMSEVTEKLMVLQKQKKDLETEQEKTHQNINVEQAVFVGSTAELLKKVKHEAKND